MQLPPQSQIATSSTEPEMLAQSVVLSPEIRVDKESVIELRLERTGGSGWVSVHCALIGPDGAIREVVLGSESSSERLVRTWIDRVGSGDWVLRAEALGSAQEAGAPAPRLELSAWLGRRSPYGWMIAAILIAIPPLFVLLRGGLRWRRRRQTEIEVARID